MAFKKSCKYKRPFFGKKKFNSFEEALHSSIMFPTIKKKVERGETVHLYLVTGLAYGSSINEVYVNKDTINRYEPSDIGEQIGYIFSKEDIEERKRWLTTFDSSKDIYDRAYITDLGINPDERYNKHLAFTSKHDANMYLEYMFTSKEEQEERDDFLARWDMYNAMILDYEEPVHDEDYYYEDEEY